MFLQNIILSLILILSALSFSEPAEAVWGSIGADMPYEHMGNDQKNEINSLWETVFDGSPKYVHTSIYENKPWPYRTWIFGYEKCKEGVDQIIDELENYNINFRSQKIKLAENNFLQAKSLLSSNPDCAKAYRAAYLSTVMMMGPIVKPSRVGLSINDKRYEQALFVIFLSNKGLIEVLDEKLRKTLANGDLESQWLVKEDNDYLITAFYDCLNSKIYVGDHLKPFNMASSLYHELDHLMRDKYGNYSFFNSTVSEGFFKGYQPQFDTDDRSIIAYLAYDELLATINGGFYQRRMLNMETDSSFGGYDHTGNEFNFYQIKGPLDRATEYIFETLNFMKESSHGYISPNSVLMALGVQDQKKNNQLARDLFCEMNQIILKGYFGHVVKDCMEYPIPYWMPGNGIEGSLFDLYTDRYYVYSPDQSISNVVKNYYNGITRLIYKLAYWELYLDKPSKTCKKVVEAQENGELESYLGTKLMKGGRNGNGGIRPIFPCQRIHF